MTAFINITDKDGLLVDRFEITDESIREEEEVRPNDGSLKAIERVIPREDMAWAIDRAQDETR